MKKILLVLIILIAIGGASYFAVQNSTDKSDNNQTIPKVTESSIKGCYVALIKNDVYTLDIQSQDGENIFGKLKFKNFEKDSSSGTFNGTYKGGILLGDYAFQSEGMNSVMQVIFKRSGDDFVRGYGEVNREGTRFTDLANINYDSSSPLSLFKKGECSTVN